MLKSLEKFLKSKFFVIFWWIAIFGVLSIILIQYLQTDKLFFDAQSFIYLLYWILIYADLLLILWIIKTYNPHNKSMWKKFLTFKILIFIVLVFILMDTSTDIISRYILIWVLFALLFSIDSRFTMLVASNLVIFAALKVMQQNNISALNTVVYAYYFIIITIILKIFDNTMLSD